MGEAVDKAIVAWGPDLPDWVMRLAEECDASSQNRVAGYLGLSATTVSMVLHNKYPSKNSDVEDIVTGKFMNATVRCPALGELPRDQCFDWRKKADAFSSANPQRVRMYRACHTCRHYTGDQKNDL